MLIAAFTPYLQFFVAYSAKLAMRIADRGTSFFKEDKTTKKITLQ